MNTAPVRVVVHPRGAGRVPQMLAERYPVSVAAPRDTAGVAEAVAAGAQVLVSFDWDAAFLGDELRWVAGRGIGTDRFPIERLVERGVVVTNGAGLHHHVVAEHAFALLLGLTRGIAHSVRASDRRSWDVTVEHELAGATVAVLGVGSVGSAFLDRARGWGLRLIGITRDPSAHPDLGVELRALPDLRATLVEADVLVVCWPRPADGVPVVGPAELAALGRGWLVNVGRGGAVDERAMIEALCGGRLRGAGLDVFEVEPLPQDSPLWAMPQVLLTPHRAGATPLHDDRFATLFGENLSAFHGRGPWINVVGRGLDTRADDTTSRGGDAQ